MKRALPFFFSFFAAHCLLGALVAVVAFMPAARSVPEPVAFYVALGVIEFMYLAALVLARLEQRGTAASAIIITVWLLLLMWELYSTKLGRLSVMIFPAPEDVFAVFYEYGEVMAYNALYSFELLVVGLLGGVLLGMIFGIVAGWFTPLRRYFHPIARALAPIPSMVVSPYVILISSSFRAASIVLVGFSIFLFVFLSMIEEVQAIDHRIIDQARMLECNPLVMVKDILLPAVLPSVISGLKIYLIMGFMMLVYSETMGASYGLGHWISVNHTHANYANLVAGIIEIGVLLSLLSKLVELVQTRLIKWCPV